jgi:hypothetical protein
MVEAGVHIVREKDLISKLVFGWCGKLRVPAIGGTSYFN